MIIHSDEKISYSTVRCPTCHVRFALDATQHDRLKETGAMFWCPNGHQNMEQHETELSRLKEKVSMLERALSEAEDETTEVMLQLEAEKRSHAATKGRVTRLSESHPAQACPVCGRSFKDLYRHVKRVHLDRGELISAGKP